MDSVVFKVFPSIHSAYQSKVASIACSITSVYNKLNHFSPSLVCSLVRDTAAEFAEIVNGLEASRTPLLPGYQVKMLDGNCIAKTEHRLEVLRHTSAGPLPGKSLVLYDHQLDLATYIIPCEDGHAQERSLLETVIPTIQPNDLLVADRNFCVQSFLCSLHEKEAFYVIRKHQQLPIKRVGEQVSIGETETGVVYEQAIRMGSDENGHDARLVTIKLNTKTRDGDSSISLVTNLPQEVSAIIIAEIYRHRWSIETMFFKLTSELKSEINSLGYPRAALFGFSLAFISYNTLSVLKSAMRSQHGEEKIENEVSGYYIAGDISRVTEGMMVALPEEKWSCFGEMSLEKFVIFLKETIKNVDLRKYKKHKRGRKKPLPKRDQHTETPHVSTFKLLEKTKKSTK